MTDQTDAGWQEMRAVVPIEAVRYASRLDLSLHVLTLDGIRGLRRVEGGWEVHELASATGQSAPPTLEVIVDGDLKAWVAAHGVTPARALESKGQLRVVYCRRCDKPTDHSDEIAKWGAMRWRCCACGLRSFDDELELGIGLAATRGAR